MGGLEVTFVDEVYRVEEGSMLTFGRSADVAVDEANQYLHRIVGSFVHHDGAWWLRNDARDGAVTLLLDDGTRISLAPGAAQVVTGRSGVVRFRAGGLDYELDMVRVDDEPGPAPPPPAPGEPDPAAGATHTFGALRLNDEQRRMLVALCEPRLRDPASTRIELPANAEVAHRLGWSLRKFDRKLDYICRRLDEQGVRGVRGRLGEQAVDRRRALVDHVVRAGLIGAADLAVLEEAVDG